MLICPTQQFGHKGFKMRLNNFFKKIISPKGNIADSGNWRIAGGGTTLEQLVRGGFDFRQSAISHGCVQKITLPIVSLPKQIRIKDGKSFKTHDSHYLNNIINNKPNKIMTPPTFFETIIRDIILNDGGYAIISRNNMGRVSSLLPISAQRVSRELVNNDLIYKISTENGTQNYKSNDIIHIPSGNGWDDFNFTGYSIYEYFRRQIDMEYNASDYLLNTLKNGVSSNLNFELQDTFGKDVEAIKILEESIQQKYGGTANAGKVIVTKPGVKAQRLASPLKDINYKEVKDSIVDEICIIFGVPLPLLSMGVKQESGGYNSLLEIVRQFVNSRLRPLAEKIEIELTNKLFTAKEQNQGYYFHIDFTPMLRGDNRQTAEVIERLIGGTQKNGCLTINEARLMFGLPNIENGDTVYTIPTQGEISKNE